MPVDFSRSVVMKNTEVEDMKNIGLKEKSHVLQKT